MVGMVTAQMKTAKELTAFAERHKAVMQSHGQILRGAKQSFMVSGKNLVSVVTSKDKVCFYVEQRSYKVHTVVTMNTGRQEKEIVLQFDNKIMEGERTYEMKVNYHFYLGSQPGFRVSTDSRWNIFKCFSCLQCAAGQIGTLWKLYKQCGLNWECWLENASGGIQAIQELYSCVMDHCLKCFRDSE